MGDSIAGRLGWVSLIYEILNEAIILPLYFFVGRAADYRDEFSDRVRSVLFLSF